MFVLLILGLALTIGGIVLLLIIARDEKADTNTKLDTLNARVDKLENISRQRDERSRRSD